MPALCNDFSGGWQTDLDAGAKRALFNVPSYLDGDTNIDINIDTRIQTSIDINLDINIDAGHRPVGSAESSQITVENVFCGAACGGAAQQCDPSSWIDHGLCAVSDQWV